MSTPADKFLMVCRFAFDLFMACLILLLIAALCTGFYSIGGVLGIFFGFAVLAWFVLALIWVMEGDDF